MRCYNCNERGHIAKECPKPSRKKANAMKQADQQASATGDAKTVHVGALKLCAFQQIMHPATCLITPREYREVNAMLQQPDSRLQ